MHVCQTALKKPQIQWDRHNLHPWLLKPALQYCGKSWLAPTLTPRAKNRAILEGQRYSSSVGTAMHWIGKTLASFPIAQNNTTHPKSGIQILCWGSALKTDLAVWLVQSQCLFAPTPFDCRHLFDTMSGVCGLETWPETTAATQLRFSVKPPWRHQGRRSPERQRQ